jgi:mono/diheme cytochrome c family protein
VDVRKAFGHAALMAFALLLAGCRGCPSSRPPIHLNPNMDNQPKLLPQAASDFFADGAAMRRPVEGTVAQGELRADRALYEGRDAGGGFVATSPIAADDRVLRRGEQRYGIYCGPCHGPAADGKGMLFQRAKVTSADLLSARLRAMPDGQLYDVVTHGVGLMPAYGAQVPVEDRWAIVAFLRRLQAETPPREESGDVGELPPPAAGEAADGAAGDGAAGAPATADSAAPLPPAGASSAPEGAP